MIRTSLTRMSPARTSPARTSGAIIAIAATAMLLAACESAPAPGTSSSPSGYVDSVVGGEGSIRVQGWASDWNTLNPIKVVFWVNGEWVKQIFTADTSRPDVDRKYARGANFGFDETLSVPAGAVTVCAVALNVGRGEDTILGCATSNSTPSTSLAPEVTTTTSTTSTTSTSTTLPDPCSTPVTATDIVSALC
jgi:hypothetical protein